MNAKYYYHKIARYGLNGALKETGLRLAISAYNNSFLIRKLAQKVVKEQKPKRWVFILGCYNSGTTLLQRVLSSHPSIQTMPREGVRFTKELRTPEDLGWTRMWNECLDYMKKDMGNDKQAVDKVIREWSPWWRGGGEVFLEKSVTNILRAEWLQEHFPNSYFIGIVRNGYAVSEGIVRRAQPKGKARQEIGEQYPIEMAAKEWVAAGNLLLGYKNSLKPYTLIHYEDLVKTPEVVVNQLFNFLELEECSVLKTANGIMINGIEHALWDGNKRSLQNLNAETYDRISRLITPLHSRYGYK